MYALPKNSHAKVVMDRAFRWDGSVTKMRTVQTNPMRHFAVSVRIELYFPKMMLLSPEHRDLLSFCRFVHFFLQMKPAAQMNSHVRMANASSNVGVAIVMTTAAIVATR